MNTKTIIAAAALLASSATAFAQEFAPADASFTSTKTRAQVAAELAEARNNGTLYVRDGEYPLQVTPPSTQTRAEVAEELAQATKAGNLVSVDSDYPAPVTTVSTKTRAEVRAELGQARKDGSMAARDRMDVGA